jgi:hypothetical protein
LGYVDGAQGLFELFPNVVDIVSHLHPITILHSFPTVSVSVITIVDIDLLAHAQQPAKPDMNERFDLPADWDVSVKIDLSLVCYSHGLPDWLHPTSNTESAPEPILPSFLKVPIWRLSCDFWDGTWLFFVKVLEMRVTAGFPAICEYVFPSALTLGDAEALVRVGGDATSIRVCDDPYNLCMTLGESLEGFDWSKLPKLRHLDLHVWAGNTDGEHIEHLWDNSPYREFQNMYNSNPTYPFFRPPTPYTAKTIPQLQLDHFALRIRTCASDNGANVSTAQNQVGELLPSPHDLAHSLLNIGGPHCDYNVEFLDSYDDIPEQWQPLVDYFRISIKREIGSILRQVHGPDLARSSHPKCTHKEHLGKCREY